VGALNAGTYAGAASDHSGNGIGLNARRRRPRRPHAQVNLDPSRLAARFATESGNAVHLVTTTALVFDVLFTAEADIRVALGQDEVTANASPGVGHHGDPDRRVYSPSRLGAGRFHPYGWEVLASAPLRAPSFLTPSISPFRGSYSPSVTLDWSMRQPRSASASPFRRARTASLSTTPRAPMPR